MNDTGRMATAVALTPDAKPKDPLWFWKAYCVTFLLIWLAVVSGFGYWVALRQHWPMSIVMILGSLVAGSTPMR